MKRDKSMNPDNMEFLIFAKERFMGEGLNTLTYDRVGKKNAYVVCQIFKCQHLV